MITTTSTESKPAVNKGRIEFQFSLGPIDLDEPLPSQYLQVDSFDDQAQSWIEGAIFSGRLIYRASRQAGIIETEHLIGSTVRVRRTTSPTQPIQLPTPSRLIEAGFDKLAMIDQEQDDIISDAELRAQGAMAPIQAVKDSISELSGKIDGASQQIEAFDVSEIESRLDAAEQESLENKEGSEDQADVIQDITDNKVDATELRPSTSPSDIPDVGETGNVVRWMSEITAKVTVPIPDCGAMTGTLLLPEATVQNQGSSFPQRLGNWCVESVWSGTPHFIYAVNFIDGRQWSFGCGITARIMIFNQDDDGKLYYFDPGGPSIWQVELVNGDPVGSKLCDITGELTSATSLFVTYLHAGGKFYIAILNDFLCVDHTGTVLWRNAKTGFYNSITNWNANAFSRRCHFRYNGKIYSEFYQQSGSIADLVSWDENTGARTIEATQTGWFKTVSASAGLTGGVGWSPTHNLYIRWHCHSASATITISTWDPATNTFNAVEYPRSTGDQSAGRHAHSCEYVHNGKTYWVCVLVADGPSQNWSAWLVDMHTLQVEGIVNTEWTVHCGAVVGPDGQLWIRRAGFPNREIALVKW
jgi:hypothetical protein